MNDLEKQRLRRVLRVNEKEIAAWWYEGEVGDTWLQLGRLLGSGKRKYGEDFCPPGFLDLARWVRSEIYIEKGTPHAE